MEGTVLQTFFHDSDLTVIDEDGNKTDMEGLDLPLLKAKEILIEYPEIESILNDESYPVFESKYGGIFQADVLSCLREKAPSKIEGKTKTAPTNKEIDDRVERHVEKKSMAVLVSNRLKNTSIVQGKTKTTAKATTKIIITTTTTITTTTYLYL